MVSPWYEKGDVCKYWQEQKDRMDCEAVKTYLVRTKWAPLRDGTDLFASWYRYCRAWITVRQRMCREPNMTQLRQCIRTTPSSCTGT